MFKAQNKLSKYWKNADLKLAKELITSLNYFRTIRLVKELEDYACYLLSSLARVIGALVLL
jgi:hypothetical protein